jgi:hypothetical protein
MTGKLDARRKWRVHVCVRKELDSTNLLAADARTTVPSRAWKPVARSRLLPARRPSPARSAASNRASVPEFESVSDAKLCGGT